MVRSDLSFTIFLNEKKKLSKVENWPIIENLFSEKEFKLNPGEIIIYPKDLFTSS